MMENTPMKIHFKSGKSIDVTQDCVNNINKGLSENNERTKVWFNVNGNTDLYINFDEVEFIAASHAIVKNK